MLALLAESAWRYFTQLRSHHTELLLQGFNHETSVILGTLVIISLCWALWGKDKKERLIAVGIMLVAGFVLMAMRRRAGLIAAEAGILTAGAILLVNDWRRFLKIAPIGLLAIGIYVGAFWNSDNSLGQPARAFRAVFDSEETTERDRSSDEYREVETMNVWWGIQNNAVTGLGFGTEYPKPRYFPDLSGTWPFWDYIPHNMILWIWLKAGVGAFLLFWFLVGSAIMQYVRMAKTTDDPWFLTAISVACAFIVMLVVYSWVDLGLISTRLMLGFGVALGLVSVLERLAPKRETTPAT
jgi:hypothetical protein